MSISASEAHRTLFPLIGQVSDDRTVVEVVSRKGSAVLMSTDEHAVWQETVYPFRSPVNARRLLDAYERAQEGRNEEHDLVREDWSAPGVESLGLGGLHVLAGHGQPDSQADQRVHRHLPPRSLRQGRET